MRSAPTRKLFTPLLLLAVAGCQQYRPSPLDLRGHSARWEARDAASRDVRAYAGTLAALGFESPDTFDPADGLSLREAEVVALFFNPRLRVARLKARVPRVGAREAGRWEDPELAIDGERIVESVDEPWVLGGTLNFTIPISGRLGAERAKAFADADAELLRAYLEEVSVLAELRAAWAEWAANGQRRELLATYLESLAEVLRNVEALQKAGEIDAADLRLFRIERATRQVELQTTDLGQRQREATIKGLLGLFPDAQVVLVPSLPATVKPASPEERRQWVRVRHPKMLLAGAEYQAAEKALALEVRKQYPDLALGGGFGTEDGQSRILFGAGLPIPLLNRNRRGIEEALANRDAAKAAVEGGFEELVGQLRRAELAAEAARQRRRLIEAEIIPLADEQVAELRRLGRAGDFNTLVQLEALRTAYEAKLQLLEAALGEATATNELNALTGVAVPPRPDPKGGRR